MCTRLWFLGCSVGLVVVMRIGSVSRLVFVAIGSGARVLGGDRLDKSNYVESAIGGLGFESVRLVGRPTQPGFSWSATGEI